MFKIISTIFVFLFFPLLISATLLFAQYVSSQGPEWLFVVKSNGEKIVGPGLVLSAAVTVLSQICCFIHLIATILDEKETR